MGFYPPASLVRDAQRRGVEVLPPDVNRSAAKCRLQGGAVRVGLGYVKGLGETPAVALVEEREAGGAFGSVADLTRRAPLDRPALEALVASGACDSFGWPQAPAPLAPRARAALDERRRRAATTGSWRSRSSRRARSPSWPSRRPGSGCSPTTGSRACPSGSIRSSCCGRTCPGRCCRAPELEEAQHGARVTVAGLAVARQRPATASGVVFMLIEDEHGQMNLIVPPPVYDRYRALVRGEPLLLARGRFERVDRNRNVLVSELASLAPLARRVADDAEVRGAMPAAHHFGGR